MATGVTRVDRSGDVGVDHRRVAELVAEWEAVGVVVGLPLGLAGTVGPAARAALDEVDLLAATLGVPVDTADERLSTVAAAAGLAAGGRRGQRARAVVDQTAAAVLLQTWLDGRARPVRADG